MRKVLAVVATALAVGIAGPPTAQATFPGHNGKIAFVRGRDIWTMNPDGTGQVNLTNDAASQSAPVWSPDGTRIAFNERNASNDFTPVKAWWMLADGSNRTLSYDGSTFPNKLYPAWSPTGTRLSFAAGSSLFTMDPDGTHVLSTSALATARSDWSPEGSLISVEYGVSHCGISDLYVAHADGSSGAQRLTNPPCEVNVQGSSWSPDAQRIAYFADEEGCAPPSCPDVGLFTIKPDGTDRQRLPVEGPNPAWSPDGTKLAFNPDGRIKIVNPDGTGVTDITDGSEPSWQPIPINAYARPKGASPFRVSLVPANAQCTSPNETHGAPLAFGSCNPPTLTSQYLTTGTPDANGRSARMTAYLLLKTVVGNPSTPADEADVKFTAHLNDVANKNLSDYTGGLRATLPLRITDKDNTPSPGGPGAATTEPFQYGFNVPCTPNPDPGIGSDCSITTTADTLVPGTIKESLRTVWQIGRARVDDAGVDGDPSTTADNTVFATQGVFIP